MFIDFGKILICISLEFIGSLKVSISKILILPTLIYGVKRMPVKISSDIFTETDRLTLNFIWKSDDFRIAKTILKKNKMELDIVKTYTTYKNQDSVVLA